MKNLLTIVATMLLAASAAAASPLQLSGEFRYQPSSLEGEQICFYPDPAGQQSILRAIKMSADQYGHDVWFCFNDTEEAAKLLGVSLKLAPTVCGFEGRASVSVSGYLPNLEEGDAVDLASLDAVGSVTGVKAIAECEEDPFAP
ncbi:hypothetical protein [Stenotrophomonas sp. Marseille-Q4652]|uniref:hypothetical protein n=1 Tax=Stenotrophomonas sp. Marseille-Q4652 TaxID=2866595 RepID=UPI001CE40833|nr:hypothetical protein [Stenotrophomonas sp. Marseille-Q4652]